VSQLTLKWGRIKKDSKEFLPSFLVEVIQEVIAEFLFKLVILKIKIDKLPFPLDLKKGFFYPIQCHTCEE